MAYHITLPLHLNYATSPGDVTVHPVGFVEIPCIRMHPADGDRVDIFVTSRFPSHGVDLFGVGCRWVRRGIHAVGYQCQWGRDLRHDWSRAILVWVTSERRLVRLSCGFLRSLQRMKRQLSPNVAPVWWPLPGSAGLGRLTFVLR